LSLSHFFLFKKIGAGLYSPTPNIIEPKNVDTEMPTCEKICDDTI
jgi:hypothetical protein